MDIPNLIGPQQAIVGYGYPRVYDPNWPLSDVATSPHPTFEIDHLHLPPDSVGDMTLVEALADGLRSSSQAQPQSLAGAETTEFQMSNTSTIILVVVAGALLFSLRSPSRLKKKS